MRLLPVLVLGILTLLPAARVRAQTEPPSDSAGTRCRPGACRTGESHDISALTGYAEFLERYGDPACRDAYARLLEVLRSAGDTARAGAIARRLAAIDLLDRQRLQGGPVAAENWPTVPIPGPWRPFARHGGHLAGRRPGRDASRPGA